VRVWRRRYGAIAPDAADLPVKSLTSTADARRGPTNCGAPESEQTYINEERVRPGDSLASLLTRLGVDDDAAASFIKATVPRTMRCS